MPSLSFASNPERVRSRPAGFCMDAGEYSHLSQANIDAAKKASHARRRCRAGARVGEAPGQHRSGAARGGLAHGSSQLGLQRRGRGPTSSSPGPASTVPPRLRRCHPRRSSLQLCCKCKPLLRRLLPHRWACGTGWAPSPASFLRRCRSRAAPGWRRCWRARGGTWSSPPTPPRPSAAAGPPSASALPSWARRSDGPPLAGLRRHGRCKGRGCQPLNCCWLRPTRPLLPNESPLSSHLIHCSAAPILQQLASVRLHPSFHASSSLSSISENCGIAYLV